MDKRFIITLVVLIVAFFGIYSFVKKDPAAETGGSTGSHNYYGKENSPVTFTEFVDFQCEACYAYYPYVKQVKEIYKDRVRFQVRYFPLSQGHQFALLAARNAQAAAQQGKFWQMHDKLFEGQKIWEKSTNPQQEYYNGYAKEIGLDMNRFKADVSSNAVNQVINKDLADVKALGGTGTPTFVLNGKIIDKTEPSVEALSKILDDALKAAGK